MTAGEFCSRDVVFCRPDETLDVVAQRMRDHHVGCLVVVGEAGGVRAPVGMLTDRDLAVRAVAAGVDVRGTRVATILSAPVQTAREHEALEKTLQRMRVHGVRRMPVVGEDGSLQGLVTLDDLLEQFTERIHDLVLTQAREVAKETV